MLSNAGLSVDLAGTLQAFEGEHRTRKQLLWLQVCPLAEKFGSLLNAVHLIHIKIFSVYWTGQTKRLIKIANKNKNMHLILPAPRHAKRSPSLMFFLPILFTSLGVCLCSISIICQNCYPLPASPQHCVWIIQKHGRDFGGWWRGLVRRLARKSDREVKWIERKWKS